MLVKPVNLKGWDDFPLRDRVAAHCGLPVTFANDANAAAYGEFWVGSGRDFHSMVLFTLGTGIGCGIIIGDLVDRRREQPRRRMRTHHHRLLGRRPALRLRPAGPSRGLRQRHGRDQADQRGPGRRPAQFAPPALEHAGT